MTDLLTLEWAAGSRGLLPLWTGDVVRPENGDTLSYYKTVTGMVVVSLERHGRLVRPECLFRGLVH